MADSEKGNGAHKAARPSTKPRGRRDSGDAFFRDPLGGPARTRDELANELAEEFLLSATSGEEMGEEMHEMEVDEEFGGPFVPSTGATEFALDEDASNPGDATREPFPTVSGRVQAEPTRRRR
ncbi:MAG: hypothetical protein U0230_20215 [Polyangiales bacterium]